MELVRSLEFIVIIGLLHKVGNICEVIINNLHDLHGYVWEGS